MQKVLRTLALVALMTLPWVANAQTGCTITIVGEDDYGDGWNGGSLTIIQNGDTLNTWSGPVAYGTNPDNITVTLPSDDPVDFVWRSGNYDEEVIISIFDGGGAMVHTVMEPTAGVFYTLNSPCPSCLAPTNLSVTDIASDGLTLYWTDAAASGEYSIDYWENGGTVNTFTTYDTFYVFTNLEPNTAYHFAVTSVCSYTDSSSAAVGVFRTDCEGGSCNITINMTDSYGDGWSGNAINVLQGGIVMGVATIEGYNDASGTAQIPVCAGIPVTLTFTSDLYPEDMGGTVIDGGGVTIFVIENMDTYANGALLASVSEPCPSCLPPTNLTATLDANGDYELSWSSDASTFMVYAGDSLYADDVTDTSYIFTGLSASSIVALGVACVCDDGDTSSIIRINVTTPCGAVTALPWSTGFESDIQGGAPLCWTILDSVDQSGEYYPMVYSSTWYAHAGMNSVPLLSEYDDDTCFIATPAFAYNPGNLHVQFWANVGIDEGAVFEAGVMTDLNDVTTFQSLFSMAGTDAISYYQYVQYEFFTDSLNLSDDDTIYIAFRLVGDPQPYSGSQVIIDDVNVKEIPNCRMPLSGSGVIDSVTYYGAQFSWDGVSEDGYDLMLVNMNGNTYDTIHIYSNTTSITVDTLLPGTLYDAYVAALCDIDGEMDTTDYLPIGMFMTEIRCYPLADAVCAAVTDNTAVLSWTYTANAGIAPTGVVITLNDLTDTTVAPVTVSVLAATTHTFTGLTVDHRYCAQLRTLCGEDDSAEAVTVSFRTHFPPCAEVSGTTTNSYIPFSSFYTTALVSRSMMPLS